MPEPQRLAESALDAPLRAWLERNGYVVRAEAAHCDLTARKDGELILIELKRRLSIELLVQATQRQRISDSVYVAIPAEAAGSGKAWRQRLHLLRRLELGLLLVHATTGIVEATLHPAPFQRRRSKRARRALLRELDGRSLEGNTAGAAARPRLTAYREQALRLVWLLEQHGTSSPRQLRDLGGDAKAGAILYQNHYGWFERIAHGAYGLSTAGRAALAQWPEVRAHFEGETA